ncbi:hypothetical protein DHEL01_v202015 [Diaporthe helianthi]|uniref:Uncharacterized protein n=1 Tax=Diaporthe helianthi TaxID=158607 RepID=A0A2P5IAQ5_DIAHE|nr:hypothetical protein DHEL01_v202015 [Diaporthe helianthi]
MPSQEARRVSCPLPQGAQARSGLSDTIFGQSPDATTYLTGDGDRAQQRQDGYIDPEPIIWSGVNRCEEDDFDGRRIRKGAHALAHGLQDPNDANYLDGPLTTDLLFPEGRRLGQLSPRTQVLKVTTTDGQELYNPGLPAGSPKKKDFDR